MKLPPFFLRILKASQLAALPLSRDKADTLLLLVACSLVLAPHAAQAPLWVTLTCGALLVWRGWITLRGNRMPPRWLLLPLAFAAMAGVYATFKTLFGREAGVAMLVLLLTLKLLEMHARRDLFAVTFLSFFLMLASFFHSQSAGTALLTIVAVIAMLAAQLSFQYTGMVPPLMQRLKLSLLIVVLAVPLTLILFILFPRIQGPLWGLPGDATTGRSGLSDTMTPGNIAELALSDDVAFRVKFLDPAPPRSKLYWRGIVLGNYNGRTWLPQTAPEKNQLALFKPRGKPIRHQVTIEPHGKRWMFALELPAASPAIPNLPSAIQADHHLLAERPIHDRIRYEVASYTDFALEDQQTAASQRAWLALPAGYNPATLALAQRLRQTATGELQLARAIFAFFREQPFRYTLEPQLLGRHAMDEFLFSTREGFCEHYASAFVILMRAAGVPARVVTGYQGGELNPVDGFLTVRQSDAHAWAEIWIEKQGWLRLDPTTAVAPHRIAPNPVRPRTQTGLAGIFSLNEGARSWLMSVRFNWDAVNNAWNQWVLNYTPARQKSLLESLGLTGVDWRTLALLLLTASTLGLAALTIPLLANRQKPDPLQALYLRFCHLMASKGLVRLPHEGPRDYRNRIMRAGAMLPPDKIMAAERFLTCYETAQYGTVSASSVAALRVRLKLLLKQCR